MMPQQLLNNRFQWIELVWTQDGSDIVFSSDRGGLLSLWRISASGGIPRSVTGVGAMAFSPSIPRKGNQLVYQHVVASDNIWRIHLKDEKHRQGSNLQSGKARLEVWRSGRLSRRKIASLRPE
jgi:Tol biopolymer transport system component